MTDETRPPDREDFPTAPRLTPFELVFSAENFELRVFPSITAEAEQRETDPAHHDQFQLLAAAGNAIRDVVPEDAPPDALEQYRALLYHAYNFWRFGKRLFLVETPVVRYLVEAAPKLSDWELAMPYPSLYVQLPANLFWGSISPGITPEPIDGFFVTSAVGEDALGVPFQRVAVLVVLGIRRDRAGFSVVPFDTETGPGIVADWATAQGREGARDFQNVLPGGEIAGLYSILTTSEVLKLLGRVLWYVDLHPDQVSMETPTGPRATDAVSALPLPRLPHHRVTLSRSASDVQ